MNDNNDSRPLTKFKVISGFLLFYFFIPKSSSSQVRLSRDQISGHYCQAEFTWDIYRSNVLQRNMTPITWTLLGLHDINLTIKQRILLLPVDAKFHYADGREHKMTLNDQLTHLPQYHITVWREIYQVMGEDFCNYYQGMWDAGSKWLYWWPEILFNLNCQQSHILHVWCKDMVHCGVQYTHLGSWTLRHSRQCHWEQKRHYEGKREPSQGSEFI